MLKFLLVFITSLLIHFQGFAQSALDTSYNFEAELQLLEKQEIETENNQMKAVENLNQELNDELKEDSISTTQASTIRSTDTKLEIKEINPESKIKTRRIRSR